MTPRDPTLPSRPGSGADDPVRELLARALAGCRRKEGAVVDASVAELIGALNFEHESAARVFFRLYEYCRREARAGRFEAPMRILGQVQEAWTVPAVTPPRQET